MVVGHEHKGYTAMKQKDGRVAVEIRSCGVELGRLDLAIDTLHHKVAFAEWKRIAINAHEVALAPDVGRQIAHWEAKVSKTVDVPIGEAKRTLKGNELRLLIERAMAEETGADFAWVNQGNVRDVLPEIGRFPGSRLSPAIAKEHSIDPDREYTVATTDFAATNQASKGELSATGLDFPKVGPLQRDAVIDWIKKKRIVE